MKNLRDRMYLFLIEMIPGKYKQRQAKERERDTGLFDKNNVRIFERDTVKHFYQATATCSCWMLCRIVWKGTGWRLKHLAHFADEGLTRRRHYELIEQNDFLRSIWGDDLRTMTVLREIDLPPTVAV